MTCAVLLARRFKAGLLVVSILSIANTAYSGFWITYSISIEPRSNVTDIALSETSDDLRSLSSPYTAFGAATTQIRTLYSEADFPTQSMLLGLITDLPDDPVTGITHAVVMMSDAAAALSSGVDWDTLFPNTTEEPLIEALRNLSSPIFDESVAASLFIDEFLRGDLANGVLDPGTGESVSFFFAPGDPFTVMAFAAGQQIGTGTSSVQPTAAVREPASATLALIGLCSIACLSRARRRRESLAFVDP
ncbi:MAG: hypothetical protein ACT4QC_03330 [Planctomycetaceae bacterium]